MKKLIILSLFVLVAATATVNASTSLVKVDDGIENISSDVLRHFGYSFYRATNISWSINKSYQKATFILNGKTTYALYDLNNNFLVATQLTVVNDLPVKLKASLSNEYADFKVSNILKVIERPSDYPLQDDTNSYWIDLSNDTKHLVLVALNDNSLDVVKTEISK